MKLSSCERRRAHRFKMEIECRHNGQLNGNNSSWIRENRDPHDVETVLRSICRYGFTHFYFRHIRKYFNRVNGSRPVSRVSGVNALHALWVDGFIDIRKRKDGNRSQYVRLFPVDDWKQVYDQVVRE